jgi:hypothetical protein
MALAVLIFSEGFGVIIQYCKFLFCFYPKFLLEFAGFVLNSAAKTFTEN